MIFEIVKADPESCEARNLIEELSHVLLDITGDNGKSSFKNSDIDSSRAVFLVLYENGKSVACGAIRPVTEEVGEIKRMYSRSTGLGFGRKVLLELEKMAIEFGYKEIWLSTRRINRKAVNFYLNNGYSEHEAYGKYRFTDKSICLAKKLIG